MSTQEMREWRVQNVDRSKFYAAALAIEATQQQQQKIDNINDSLTSSVESPQKVTVPSTNVSRQFLDAVAHIFSQSRASDVVATALEQAVDDSRTTFTVYVAKNNGDYTHLKALKRTFEEWSHTLNELWYYGPDTEDVGPSLNKDLLQLDDDLWVSILQHSAVSIGDLISDSFAQPSPILGLKAFLSDVGYGAHWLRPKYRETYTQPEVFSTATAMLAFIGSLLAYTRSHTNELLRDLGRNKELNGDGEIFGREAADMGNFGKPNRRDKPLTLRHLHNATMRAYAVLQRHGYLVEELINEWPGDSKMGKPIMKLLVGLTSYPEAMSSIYEFKKRHPRCDIRINFLPPNGKIYLDVSDIKDKRDEHIRKQKLPKWRLNQIFKKQSQKYGSNVSCTVHCEMQLLQKFLAVDAPNINSVFNYFGCSKGPCWLCWHTLKGVTNYFDMREPHLKVYARWWPPSFQGVTEQRLATTLGNLLTDMNKCLEDPRQSFQSLSMISDLGPLDLRGHTTVYEYNKRMHRQNLPLLITEELDDMGSRGDWSAITVK